MSSPALERSAEKQKVVAKRSMAIAGRKTSFSLEDAFWKALRENCRQLADDYIVAGVDDRQGASAPEFILGHSLVCTELLSKEERRRGRTEIVSSVFGRTMILRNKIQSSELSNRIERGVPPSPSPPNAASDPSPGHCPGAFAFIKTPVSPVTATRSGNGMKPTLLPPQLGC
jgi:predicted DNA-binding ribbon-helix-helix protein